MTATRRRVLIVEDEVFVAMLLEDMLLELGCEVAGILTHFDEALAAAATIDADFAILDVNLDGKRSFPIAAVLRARGIAVVFATGYGESVLADAQRDAQRDAGGDAGAGAGGAPGGPWGDIVALQKPFQFEDLQAALKRAGFVGG